MALEVSGIIPKKPSEKIKISFEFTKWISENTVLSNPVVTSTPTGLTITDTAVEGQYVTFYIAEGISGQNYSVYVQVTTSDGETLVGEGLLRVRG